MSESSASTSHSEIVIRLYESIKTFSSILKGSLFCKLVWGNGKNLENFVNRTILDFSLHASKLEVKRFQMFHLNVFEK